MTEPSAHRNETLSPAHRVQLRALLAKVPAYRVGRALGTTELTMQIAESGGQLLPRTRERLEAKLDELAKATNPVAVAGGEP